MTEVLGPRLVVFAAIGTCDTKHEHSVRLVTDGTIAYAYADSFDTDLVSRVRETITVSCQGPVAPIGEPCWGEVTFNLDDGGSWSSSQADLDILSKYGKRIDKE